MISPEEMAKICLNDSIVTRKDNKVLFFKKAAVVVFDGLILWRGNLNMSIASKRLQVLAEAIGLPVAVIEQKHLARVRKVGREPGKFLGPGYWKNNRAWDSVTGLNKDLASRYDIHYNLVKDTMREKPLTYPKVDPPLRNWDDQGYLDD